MSDTILQLTTTIVSAFMANNQIAVESLPTLIRDTYRTLGNIDGTPTEAPAEEPAVSAKKSVFPDYIVCMCCGKQQRTLKRHLMSAHGLTPEQYRNKWGLPADYPLVAPNYSKTRSGLAKKHGLGHSR